MYQLLRLCLLAFVTVAFESRAAEVRDTLTYQSLQLRFGVNQYDGFENKSLHSMAVYAGSMAHTSDNALQIRASDGSGVVTTQSGGKLKAVIITFTERTEAGRTIEVYGKDTPYGSAKDLYDAKAGVNANLVGSAVKVDGETSYVVTPEVDCRYVGIKLSAGKTTTLRQIVVVWETEDVVLTVSSAGYTTLYYGSRALSVPEGVTAYTCHGKNGQIALGRTYVEGNVIPPGEAVLVKASPDAYTFVEAGQHGSSDPDNLLCGTDAETFLAPDAACHFYALTLNTAGDPASVGFYWMNDDGSSFANGAHKAYLKVPKDNAASAKPSFLLRGAVTGIGCLAADAVYDDKAPRYNLAGQRVSKEYKGMVIQAGKKYMIHK